VTLGQTISGAKWKESRAARPSTPVLRRTPALSKPYGKYSGALVAWDPRFDPRRASRCGTVGSQGSYLVDPASSHMLVSKIKPCMSKYKLLYTVKLRMAH